mgnify:CR=1 FL=1
MTVGTPAPYDDRPDVLDENRAIRERLALDQWQSDFGKHELVRSVLHFRRGRERLIVTVEKTLEPRP